MNTGKLYVPYVAMTDEEIARLMAPIIRTRSEIERERHLLDNDLKRDWINFRAYAGKFEKASQANAIRVGQTDYILKLIDILERRVTAEIKTDLPDSFETILRETYYQCKLLSMEITGISNR